MKKGGKSKKKPNVKRSLWHTARILRFSLVGMKIDGFQMRILVYLFVSLTILGASAQQESSIHDDTRGQACNADLGGHPVTVTPKLAEKILGPYELYKEGPGNSIVGGPGPQVAKALNYLMTHKQKNIRAASYNFTRFLYVIKRMAAADSNVGSWVFREYTNLRDGSVVVAGFSGHGVVFRPGVDTIEVFRNSKKVDFYFNEEIAAKWPTPEGYSKLVKVGEIQIYKEKD